MIGTHRAVRTTPRRITICGASGERSERLMRCRNKAGKRDGDGTKTARRRERIQNGTGEFDQPLRGHPTTRKAQEKEKYSKRRQFGVCKVMQCIRLSKSQNTPNTAQARTYPTAPSARHK